MTTNHHSPYPFGGPLTAAAMEAPLGQLDAAIASVIGTGSGASTSLTAQALAGQASLTVASSSGIVPGDVVFIGDAGGTYESRIVNTVPNGTTITVTVNLSNTYASGKPVSKSPVEIVDARGIYASLGGRLSALEGRLFDAKRYGATGDGATDDTSALQAWLTAAGNLGIASLPAGTYLITAALTLVSGQQIRGAGRQSVIKRGNAFSGVMLDGGTDVVEVSLQDFLLDANKAGGMTSNGNGMIQALRPRAGASRVCTCSGRRRSTRASSSTAGPTTSCPAATSRRQATER